MKSINIIGSVLVCLITASGTGSAQPGSAVPTLKYLADEAKMHFTARDYVMSMRYVDSMLALYGHQPKILYLQTMTAYNLYRETESDHWRDMVFNSVSEVRSGSSPEFISFRAGRLFLEMEDIYQHTVELDSLLASRSSLARGAKWFDLVAYEGFGMTYIPIVTWSSNSFSTINGTSYEDEFKGDGNSLTVDANLDATLGIYRDRDIGLLLNASGVIGYLTYPNENGELGTFSLAAMAQPIFYAGLKYLPVGIFGGYSYGLRYTVYRNTYESYSDDYVSTTEESGGSDYKYQGFLYGIRIYFNEHHDILLYASKAHYATTIGDTYGFETPITEYTIGIESLHYLKVEGRFSLDHSPLNSFSDDRALHEMVNQNRQFMGVISFQMSLL